MITTVKKVEFLAEPVCICGLCGDSRHYMTITVDGRHLHSGISTTDQTPREIVNRFREQFPGVEVKLIDRTVQ